MQRSSTSPQCAPHGAFFNSYDEISYEFKKCALILSERIFIFSFIKILSYFVFEAFNNKIPTIKQIGNTNAVKIPIFKFSDAKLEIPPTSVGPPEHPTSPASASSANIAVPPFLREADALLNVPGHIIPTDKPQIAQPTSEKNGDGESEMHR